LFKLLGWFRKQEDNGEVESNEQEYNERSFAVGDLCVRVIGDKVKIARTGDLYSFVETNNDVYEFMKVFSNIQRIGISSHLGEASSNEEKLLMVKTFNGIFFSLANRFIVHVIKYVHRPDDYVFENGNELIVELVDHGGAQLTAEFVPVSGNLFVSLEGFGSKTFDSFVSIDDVLRWIDNGFKHVSKE
jgi:hypothetical protein